MSSTISLIRKKKDGAKFLCLMKTFDMLFPMQDHLNKNSVGIYTPDDFFKLKRGVTYSTKSFCLNQLPTYNTLGLSCLESVSREPHVWAICGRSATRANEVENMWFLLCYQSGKHFISQAIIEINGGHLRLNVDNTVITRFLDEMLSEMVSFKAHQNQLKSVKRTHREREDYEDYESKVQHVDSPFTYSSCSSDFSQAVPVNVPVSPCAPVISLPPTPVYIPSPDTYCVQERPATCQIEEIITSEEVEVIESSETSSVPSSMSPGFMVNWSSDEVEDSTPYDIFYDALGMPTPETNKTLVNLDDISSPRLVPTVTYSEQEFPGCQIGWTFHESYN